MTYKYIPASLSGENSKTGDPKNQYIELFQRTLIDGFYNASDWWTIEEETYAGSKTYTKIDVRISHVINAETGLKLGDDWKTILFKEIDHSIDLGKLYIFDNNTWLTVNTEYIKNLTGTCTIRRCNNTLRWIDEKTGVYYEEPCCIEYLVKEPRDYATQGSPFTTPGGFLHITMQFNERTNKIKQNQRFLFGNKEHWTCYKVVGTGINDFRNAETYNNSSAKILSLDLIANFVNDELDDIVNGIADVNTNLYQIILNTTSIENSIGTTFELIPTIIYNGDTVSRKVIWETSNPNIATVDENGIVSFLANGTCSIKATIENNPVYALCNVIVTPTPSLNYEIRISPDVNYILEGMTKVYTAYLYVDGVQQPDPVYATCNPNAVPTNSFIFTQITANSFEVQNLKKNVDSYLSIQCTSGAVSRTFNIYLRGAWLYGNI